MKIRTILLLGLFFVHTQCTQSKAHSLPHSYKIIPLVTKETFTLNSGGRSIFGGKSRNYIPVQLPPHTVEWYYAVTTTPEQVPAPTINLAEQLIKFLTSSGLMASVIGSLMIPRGSGVCDVFLLHSKKDLNTFLAKKGNVTSLMSGTRQNFNQGAVRINDDLSGNYFLAMRNPSAFSAVKITIEVSALVRE